MAVKYTPKGFEVHDFHYVSKITKWQNVIYIHHQSYSRGIEMVWWILGYDYALGHDCIRNSQDYKGVISTARKLKKLFPESRLIMDPIALAMIRKWKEPPNGK